MHGWEELTDRVESVVATLPQAERENLVIFASNYGQAGAIEYFGRGRGLPPVASPHNNYWLWGPAGWSGGTAITIGLRPDDAAKWFEEIEDRGTPDCEWCMPMEQNAHILIVRKPRISPSEIWQRLRRFI
jgi:hypothetical protein